MQIIIIRDFDTITMMHVKLNHVAKPRYSTSYVVDLPILQGLMIPPDEAEYFWEKEWAKHKSRIHNRAVAEHKFAHAHQ
jgi:hypothetical protein